MNGSDFGEIKDLNAAANYIQQKSRDKTHIFRGILSLKEEDALRLGYENKEDWQKLLYSQIYEIAEKIGIPPSNLEFAGAIHLKDGHPHLHYTFWEKDQGVRKAWITPKTNNDIRIGLIKSIFKNDLAELHAIKNEARTVLTGNAGEFFKDFFEPYQNMNEEEYKKVVADIIKNPKKASVGLTNFNMSPKDIETFATKIFNFRDKLPTDGRINYKFLPAEQKEELKGIVCDLVEYNADFKREYDRYIETSVKLAAYFIKESDGTEKGDLEEKVAYEEARQNAKDEITKRLANKLLTSLKKTNRANKSEDYKKSATTKMLTDLFSFLFKENEDMRGSKIGDNKRELSKQAKKELAIKNENASNIEWEDEFDR